MKVLQQKFYVLFSLYIAQAIPMSFFSTIMPVIMRQENYSLESIGLIQLVKLPWIFKFLWAPLVDRYSNKTSHYRSWIFGSEIFYALVIFSIGFLSLEFNFQLIIALIIIAFIASATQDIATDAYAILLLKVEERGFGNSMQSSGSFIGTLVGSGALLIVYHYFGWQLLLFALAGFVLVALVPLLFFKKNGQIVKQQTLEKTSGKDIWTFFTQKGIHKHILVLIFYYSGFIGILAMLKPYLVDLQYSAKEIGFMAGIYGTLVAAVSALFAGWIIKKVERSFVFFMFAGVGLSAGLFFLWITAVEPTTFLLYIGITILWMAYGLSTVVIYTTSMDKVRPGREGTDFTMQIVLTHLSSLIISVLSGQVAGKMGYQGLFAAQVFMALITFSILFYAKPRELNYGKS
jgi:MFS family permease